MEFIPLTRTFKYCPACGGGDPSAERGKIECARCGHLFYVNPAVAVGVILRDPMERTLWVVRANEPSKGMLGMAGGFVDAGETLEEAARREAREEIGVELGELEFVCSAPNYYRYRGIEYSVVDCFFTAVIADFADARALDEVAGLAILERDAVDPAHIAFPSMRAAWQAFLHR